MKKCMIIDSCLHCRKNMFCYIKNKDKFPIKPDEILDNCPLPDYNPERLANLEARNSDLQEDILAYQQDYDELRSKNVALRQRVADLQVIAFELLGIWKKEAYKNAIYGHERCGENANKSEVTEVEQEVINYRRRISAQEGGEGE